MMKRILLRELTGVSRLLSRPFSRRLSHLSAAALLLLAAAAVSPAAAQIGTTTQIITGHVVGPDSQPINGARIDITSIETGVIKHTTTHSDGRFSMLFRDGGASYTVRITYIGLAPATVTLTRQADEDRLVAEVKLAKTVQQLAAVQVRANANRPGAPPASGAGATGFGLPPELIQRMPVLAGDLAAIAALAPGVVPTSATDSTPASFSVAGQPPAQNNVTVDGSSFLFGSLPQDAVRAVRVITNVYDVSRGQFTGGQITTTTKSGTSLFQGTTTVNLQQPSLQFPTSTSPTFGQKYTQTTGSFGVGGPVGDHDVFYFGSLQYDRKSDAVASLLDASSGALANLGANVDSVSRFRQIVARNGLGNLGSAPTTRLSTTLSSLARVDWDINESHSLMLRGDYRHLGQDATRISPLALPQTGGSTSSDGGGAMATLTSSLGNFINEGRIYASQDHQSAAAFLAGPAGVVTVASGAETSNTTAGVTTLQFGGSPALPRSTTNRLVEASDELSWLVGDHRLKLGGLLNVSRSTIGAINNRFGTFIYNSLADFDAGHPALFARTLSGADQSAGSNNGALYLGDAYRHSATLQFVYGVRAEATRLPNAPADNPAVSQAFGRSTSDWPTDFAITPRFGFTYLIWNDAGLPAGSIRGGIGEFRGTIPSPLVAAARNGTGVVGSQTQLLCVGSAVPVPNWSAYLADAGTIPDTCAGSGSSTFGSVQPNVILLDKSFGAPDVWRASLGFTKRIGTFSSIGMDGLFAYGINSPFGEDINLPAPSFVLAGEGGRPVFAQANAIVPGTGTASPLVRPHSAFGPVISLGSGLKSRTGQVTTSVTIPGVHSGLITFAYTWNRVLDQSDGFALGSYVPNTAGNPNTIEWGTSDLERRHQVIATSLIPFSHGIDFTVIGRLLSGARYTPSVNGDVNGDGQRNDRAFVPGAGSSLSSDIDKLIATTDDRAADCIRSQEGRIASRNSCTTPWTPQLDFQVNWQPRARVFDDRLTVSLVATNTLAGVDRVLHGDNLHGWGQPVFPDRTLLSIAGFDQQSRQYLYKVNGHFGSPTGAGSAFLVPFQLGLRGQVKVGSDPVKVQLKAVTGGANGGKATLAEVKERISKGLPTPVKSLVEQADSLKLNLTRDQRVKLNAISTKFSQQADSIITVIAQLLVDAGDHPDLGALAPKIQPANIFILKALQQSVKDAQNTLTPEQWAKVPERIRLPLSAPPPSQQQQRPPAD
ncbi:MAG TPA: carboxypeptidase-like regulatory domain-containing protein [Gemmatimonadaceae bacterium]|nr:carboxypeptidase-like regulatory domain-containing protein [Gemmatimonadaceae bacterium]